MTGHPGPAVENHLLRLTRFGPDLRESSTLVREPVGQLGAGQVLVRQHWAGVNGLFDNVLARGHVPYVTKQPPFDLGVEAIGAVAAVGEGVTGLRVGDAVATSQLGAGYRLWLVTDEHATQRIPALDPRYVALRTSAVSALLALERAGRMGAGETVLITAAAGGLGQFLVQFAKQAGNTVIGVCGGAAKAELLARLGCDRVVDRTVEDLGEVLDREHARGVDLAVDTVGGALFDTLLARLAPLGRLVVAGHASDLEGAVPAPVLQPRVYQHLYWTAASVVGFQNALYAAEHAPAFARILEWDRQGLLEVAIDPQRFAGLESVHDAVDHLVSGRSIGKVVLDLRPAPAPSGG